MWELHVRGIFRNNGVILTLKKIHIATSKMELSIGTADRFGWKFFCVGLENRKKQVGEQKRIKFVIKENKEM